MPDPPPPGWIEWIKELGIPGALVVAILFGGWKGGKWLGPKMLELATMFITAQVDYMKESTKNQQESLQLHRENTQTLKVQSEMLHKLVEIDRKLFPPRRKNTQQ
jgi:hypothetical protein